jgi:hypothetical protein
MFKMHIRLRCTLAMTLGRVRGNNTMLLSALLVACVAAVASRPSGIDVARRHGGNWTKLGLQGEGLGAQGGSANPHTQGWCMVRMQCFHV